MLTAYVIVAAAFAVTLTAVIFSHARASRLAWAAPTAVALAFFCYLFIARPRSSTAGLIVPFGFFWAALGSIPAAIIGALARFGLSRHRAPKPEKPK